AWSHSELDDLFLVQFVFYANDDARIIGRIFQIINDHSLDLCPESSHQMPNQIMGEWPLLGNLTHEHGDRAAHCLIDINDEHLVVVSNEYCAAAARWQNRPHLHLDHRFVHRLNATRGRVKNKPCSIAAS